ncbi:MAG TPA: endolytic transglycosylase MltG [Paludibacter sp.]|nr:endolytic transglycosylase MltG [Paludibacter sp.]
MTDLQKQEKKTFKLNKSLLWVGVLALILFLYMVFVFFAPNIQKTTDDKAYLRIPDNSTFENVIDSLEHNSNVRTVFTFRQASKLFRYGKKIRPGRYELKNGMTNFELVRKLRSGNQTPVRLTFNNIRTKEQLAKRLSNQLMADSVQIINLLNDTAFLSVYNLNPNNSVSIFIPDTYEVFWDMDAKEIFDRMMKEYNKFWTDERKKKAEAIPLTPTEVIILASIVEEETNGKSERPVVAGLYINRLQKGIALQADPTVKFAVGDFGLKRILIEHVLKISPYNTYRNTGLPPGPIRVASANGIDAVLNYSHHDYVFMCAKETLNGEHNFAVTYAEHQVNAGKYQRALNERKIFK